MCIDDPVAIIGGGAAGLLASWRSASLGASVLLAERNARVGIKLLISGGGKCNVTHSGSVEQLLDAFLPAERRFLKPSVFRFSNEDIMRLLAGEGVPCLARPDGRVFPERGLARDVVRAITEVVRRAGARMLPAVRVRDVRRTPDGFLVAAESGNIAASKVILATGGVSYPKTGTTGDGIEWARQLGHSIVPLRPALAPIGVMPAVPAEWRGVAVRGGRLSVWANAKPSFSWEGDILFTHEGVSGPAALEVSRHAAVIPAASQPELRLDFFPEKDFAALDEELNVLIRDHPSRMIGSVLAMFVPGRLADPLLRSAGVDPEKRGHVLTREERRAATGLLKSWTIGIVSRIDVERGEVTAGGVALDEVDPRTMQSRICPGLYLCGEMLDIAGPVGGYNLQAAFSTGFVAGDSAGRAWLSDQSAGAATGGNQGARDDVVTNGSGTRS